MFVRILLLLLVMPVVELALLIRVSRWIGFLPTVGLLVVTALLGSYMVRREGLTVWKRLQSRLQSAALPGEEIVDGVIVLASGIMLIAPGLITDVIGFLGLIPISRRGIRNYLMARFRRSIQRGTTTFGFGSFGSVTYEHPEQRQNHDQADSGWMGTPREIPGEGESNRD